MFPPCIVVRMPGEVSSCWRGFASRGKRKSRERNLNTHLSRRGAGRALLGSSHLPPAKGCPRMSLSNPLFPVPLPTALGRGQLAIVPCQAACPLPDRPMAAALGWGSLCPSHPQGLPGKSVPKPFGKAELCAAPSAARPRLRIEPPAR